MMMLWMHIVTAALLAFTPIAAAAQNGDAAANNNAPAAKSATASDSSEDARQILATNTPEKSEDLALETRIRSIFAQIESLQKVSVEVHSGVVILAGEVSDTDDAARAEEIASRVSGVVTVENKINRTQKVSQTISPVLKRMLDKAANILSGLPILIFAMLAGWFFWYVGKKVSNATNFWNKVAPNRFLADSLAATSRLAFLLLGMLVAFDILGASSLTTAILGSAGVLGLAIGFAIKDTVSNYVSSLMLSVRQPFRVNDHVVINDREGRVMRLTSRATILMTPDGNHLRIPNATVYQAEILNFSRNPQRRFDFMLGIDPADDPKAAMELGVSQMVGLEYLLDMPEPSAQIEEVADSTINLRFLAWVDQTKTDWHKARSETIRKVKNILEKEGFGLPDPTYRLRFASDAQLTIDGTQDNAQHKEPETKHKVEIAIQDAHDSSDVSADTYIIKKIAEERRQDDDTDLLDSRKPTE